MNLAEYASYDGLGLADLVRRKEVAPRELCHLALQAIESSTHSLNAVIETFPERADSAQAPGPFAGVPFLVKDFPIEADVKAEMGSQLAAGFAPARDSELMLRFRKAGLINLGRTTTSEFGLAALTVSRHTGATRNPWDLARSTAGSSGGSAAAVAAGIVPLASGGDGGGSIRNPASFCGLVGLKPTRGRISLGPDTGDPYSGMVVGFVLTRTVRDCAAMLDAVEGPAIGDPFEIPRPAAPLSRGDRAARRPPAHRCHDQGVVGSAARSRSLGRRRGHREASWSRWATPSSRTRRASTMLRSSPRRSISGSATPPPSSMPSRRPSAASPANRICRRRAGRPTSPARPCPPPQLVAAEEHYNLVTRAVAQFLAGYDVLLTPTNTCLPLPLDAHKLDAPGATVKDLFDHLAPIETFTALFNGTGHPPYHCRSTSAAPACPSACSSSPASARRRSCSASPPRSSRPGPGPPDGPRCTTPCNADSRGH